MQIPFLNTRVPVFDDEERVPMPVNRDDASSLRISPTFTFFLMERNVPRGSCMIFIVHRGFV
jgi:hypothetical protein